MIHAPFTVRPPAAVAVRRILRVMARATNEVRDLHSIDAAERLSTLSHGLLRGELVLEQDGQRMRYKPGSIVRVAIRAEENDDAGSVTIRVVWRRQLAPAVSLNR